MKLHLLFILLFLTVQFVEAQDPTAPKVTIYKPFNANESVNPDKVYEEKYCAKWNFYLMGRGVFNLSLERMLTKQLSAQAGLGVTYRDWIFEFFNEEMLSAEQNDIDQNISFGPMFNLSLRYYPKDGELEGMYISPMIRYRKYNMTTIPAAYTQEKEISIGYKMMEYGFLFGYQWNNYFWDNMSDFYVGVGLSNLTYQKYEEINASGDHDWVKKTRQAPILFMSLEIGIPF